MTTLESSEKLLVRVLSIGVEAGVTIMGHYGVCSSIVEKSDASPLTEADTASHTLIEESLRSISPRIQIVSEEGSLHSPRDLSGLWWLVDPLDGTREFISGNGQFTVNIALMSGSGPLWGVVHAPALGETFWGGRFLPGGAGAWCRKGDSSEVRVRAQAMVAGDPMRVLASRSHMDAATRAFIEALGSVDLVQAGSSLKFCRVAEGSADVYPRLAPTSEWDTAAAQAVLEGAGGAVLQLDGTPLRYGRMPFKNPPFVAVAGSAFTSEVSGAIERVRASGAFRA
ncbi:MAG: 3'(2'),5'-bisphosphate nucleotidase CysQ [Planctomycetota bacterium]|nr:3'(2'),5'-bisphosphate nucleotidase CysQ [Planctomycetota bacterium]MDA1106132.1 3'(2'),5'-bisphosphate nucleotidase CysQ [Planctomycetota bacterium]